MINKLYFKLAIYITLNFFILSFNYRCLKIYLTLFRHQDIMCLCLALLVQLVERRFPKPDVEGSSPSGRVKKKDCFSLYYFLVECYDMA